MKVEYINPFIASTQNVFSTLLGCQLIRGEPFAKETNELHHEISGVIGLSGKARGTVVLSLDEEVALEVTAIMLHKRPTQINAEVTDAIGELTNIIAGRAKSDLEQFALSVSLPTVVVGKSHSVEFPSSATRIGIPFESPWGPLTVEVGLVVEPVEAAMAG